MVSFSYVTAKKSVKYQTLFIGSFPTSPREDNLPSGGYSVQKITNFTNFTQSQKIQDSIFVKIFFENEFLKDLTIYQNKQKQVEGSGAL